MAEIRAPRFIGSGVRRREDARLLRGEGLYVGDIHLPGMAHAAILRSSYAHARIKRVDLSGALRQPGVLAALTCADFGHNPPTLPNLMPHKLLHSAMPYPLARDQVRYVGEPIAVVVAESRYEAEDALEAIDVEYEELPIAVNPESALSSGAPLLHDHLASNLAAEMTQTVGDPDRAFAEADVVIRLPFHFGRASGQPLEGRGVVARYERSRSGGAFTVWASTQMPHNARRVLAGMLGVPLQAVRVIAPDIGGGFGVKIYLYPEEFLVAYLARIIGRPVRWIEDRRESFLGSYQARDQYHDLEVAADRDGTILGIRSRFTVDMGAYSPWGLVVPFNAATTLPGPYRLRNYQVTMRAVYTNKPPVAPYRAAGRPPAVFAMERALDLVARKLDLDPAEVRFRNLVQPEDFPYRLGLIDRDGTELTYDSGNYPACLRQAMELLDIPAFRREQKTAHKEGRYLGLGMGCYVEPTGRGPFEGATVRVEPSGQVLVITGAVPQGQSHETTLAQVCADRLGVDLDQVAVVTGDTETIGLGVGSFASRTAVVAGNAVSMAALSVREKALRVAAELLEVSVEDLELTGGVIRVRGVPDREVSLARVAQTVTAPPPAFTFPQGLEPGLEATHYFHPISNTYASGAHIASIEVDAETGIVKVLRYIVVHDCGTVINPVVVEGQVHGGVAQGLGNAIYEELAFDDDGQPLTTSYMHYLIPTAVEVPGFTVGHEHTRSPLNPEGIKGAGEGGTMPVPGVIANAIDDALSPLGVTVDRIPITPPRLLEKIRAAWTIGSSAREPSTGSV
jgi:carbon-monoxide dehydrogenase large subunit